METHVKVLGVLHIVLGILGALGALAIIVIFGGVATLIGMNDSAPEAQVALPIVGAIGSIIAIFVLLISLPGIIAGIGLLQYRPWARTLTIIISALELLNIPIGTALGIYGLWVLLSQRTERLFAAPVRY